VFADIDPAMRVVSAQTVRPCITAKTKAIVVVHLYGLPADMDPILELAGQRGIKIVEDVAQSPGGIYKGKRTGSIGDYGCFSFQNQKNISTLGEGGMLTVKEAFQGELARKLRWMGHWPFAGPRDRYWVPAMGNLVSDIEGVWPFNFCLSEVQCAVGRQLLKRLDAINEERRAQASLIRKGLADVPELSFQQVPEGHVHAYHLLSARYDGSAGGKTRDDLIELLFKEYGIKCVVQYWPLYRSDLFRAFGYGNLHLPNTDHFFDNMVSFPFWSGIPQETLHYMVASIREAVEKLRERGK
jgi:dTDP-4-amino-4,6-dideoxygalactose transaminase